MNSVEVSVDLRSLQEFQALHQGSPELFDRTWIQGVANDVVSRGAVEPLTGIAIPPGELSNLENLREGLVFGSINSRLRTVMMVLEEAVGNDPKIYAAEAITPFALKMRGIFPKFIGSEYAPDRRGELFPIPSEDLLALSFPSDVFDVVLTNEVLEHVPSIDAALREIRRVLKSGGWHIGTVPFACVQDTSIRKAELRNGRINHLMEPEYHGNPISGDGSLVFEVPGWDIIQRARRAGFSDAYMRFILSSRHACMSSDLGGNFILCLRK